MVAFDVKGVRRYFEPNPVPSIYFDSQRCYNHSLDSARGIRPNTVIPELCAK